MKLQPILLVLCLLASIPVSAQNAKNLLVYRLANHASLTDAEAARVNEVFQNRLRAIKAWSVIDSTVIQTQGVTGVCDQECQIALAQKLGASLLIAGSIEPSADAGYVEVQATLIDPNSWKELQRETVTIGPEIEKELGKVSSFAKLFDPQSSSVMMSQEEPTDKTSTAANWVLGGGALAVLAIVLYSLL